jgi:PAS domain S-box-containing protein
VTATRAPGPESRVFDSRRALIAPIALLTVLAAMSVFLAITHLIAIRQTRQWVDHSHQVIETTQTLLIEILNVESGQRGYLLTKDEHYLEYYETATISLPPLMNRLRGLVASNPAQSRRVDHLIAMARQRMAISAWRVALVRAGRVSEATSASLQPGRAAMRATRAAVNEVMVAERELLRERTNAAEHAELVGLVIALWVGALAVAGVAASLWSMALANRRLAHEIREREGAEAAHRESEALYRAIFANTADFLFVIDIAGEDAFTVGELNPAFEHATGITTAAARGQDIRSVIPRSIAEPLVARYRSTIAAGQPALERGVYSLPGGVRTWESLLVPVRDRQGRIERIVGSARDVTDRDRAEDQLRRAQRMEAIGHLTGGVAHDFNNLLQVIRGNLELIVRDLIDKPAAAQRLKSALYGADRAAQLTRQLLAFARRQPLEPAVVNPGRMMGDLADILRRMLGESISVETRIADDLWNTLADPAQVESALLNLALNARDAMPEGGRLAIDLSNAWLDQDHAMLDSEVEPGEYVLIAVSDTGHGMEPRIVARVFEPFFTTKSVDKGTGLGLSMVYGFVKQSNGHVQIQSEVGQGTTVKIFLPRALQDETVAEPAVFDSLEGRREVILVVEDDDLVRAASVGLLRDLGYTCLHAPDAAAALDRLRSGVKIDLLFTDVVMPGPVRSRDLADEARRLKPDLPVLFTSGFSEGLIVHEGRVDPGVQLISKPYTRDDLARKIRTLLNRARPVVLVVEDDPLVRMAAVDMIGGLGFNTLQAADADAALARLRDEAKVDVLFTDIGLPGMRGPELAEAALALRPGLKVIFASGYADHGETAIDGAAHMVKPYQQDELALVLNKALA